MLTRCKSTEKNYRPLRGPISRMDPMLQHQPIAPRLIHSSYNQLAADVFSPFNCF